MTLKSIEKILETPVKYKTEFAYLEKVHETYRGVNRNIHTNEDIDEAIHTAAGIDDYAIR